MPASSISGGAGAMRRDRRAAPDNAVLRLISANRQLAQLRRPEVLFDMTRFSGMVYSLIRAEHMRAVVLGGGVAVQRMMRGRGMGVAKFARCISWSTKSTRPPASLNNRCTTAVDRQPRGMTMLRNLRRATCQANAELTPCAPARPSPRAARLDTSARGLDFRRRGRRCDLRADELPHRRCAFCATGIFVMCSRRTFGDADRDRAETRRRRPAARHVEHRRSVKLRREASFVRRPSCRGLRCAGTNVS